ncbi:MAG: neutral zinc metallopeptidase [Pseudonocardia sp.]
MVRTAWIAGVLVLLLAGWPSAASAETPAPAAQPQCQSLENCYSYGGMREFLGQVQGLIAGFAGTEYGTLPEPAFRYVPAGTVVRVTCGGVADSTAFFYCGLDDTIYVGQDQLYDFYRRTGDGGAAFAVAHEWGHYLQDRAGVLRAATGQVGRIQSENQADCIGGAFLGHARDRGILEPDDYDDIGAILPLIASAESDMNRDHGTVQERAQAVQYGFDRGLSGCSGYFPDTPLVV